MNSQPIFAGGWEEWNLFGTPVWFFLGVGIVAAFFVSRRSPLPIAVQHRLRAWLPALMLFGCLFPRWIHSRSGSFLGHEYFHKAYYAELDTAFIICLAFGVGFTLDLLRATERRCRIVGWIFASVYVGLLVVALWAIREWHLENARWATWE